MGAAATPQRLHFDCSLSSVHVHGARVAIKTLAVGRIRVSLRRINDPKKTTVGDRVVDLILISTLSARSQIRQALPNAV